jgi:hypothetical protein
MTPLVDEVLALHRRGFALVPVPYGRKGSIVTGWQHLRLDEAGLRAAFAAIANVGVLLGTPSGGLVDVDLDCPEALALASAFLPPTALRSGRTSAPSSHRFYRVTTDVKTAQYRDPRRDIDGARSMLVEVRSTGVQTLVPPSVHPSGESIAWDQDGEPAQINAVTLQQAATRIAAGSLLARCWPTPGSRHAAALALGGGLLRAGWVAEEASTFVWHISLAAGDEEAEDRRTAVTSSSVRLAAEGHATGWPTLAKLIDAQVVAQVRGWLGITAPAEAQSSQVSGTPTRWTAPEVTEQRVRAIPVPPFPLKIFPPIVARYLADGATTVGCPVDLIAVPFLGYVAAAIGRQRRIAIKRHWVRKPTLWTGVVATSGSGKSPADAYARQPLDILQKEADERYAEQVTAYKRAYAEWRAADPASRGDEPALQRYEHWYTTDPTVESLAPMLQGNPGIAAAFDELVAWARGCNAYKKGGNDRQKYLEIWNGRSLKIDRKTHDVIFVEDPVCCLVGGIQPERLPELTREASVHDGLLPRFCWTYPDVPPAGWSWDERESDDLEEIVTLFRQLRTAPPLVLRPHPDARTQWAAWYDKLKAQHRTLPPLARELASKQPAHLATLWLVLQALHDPEGRIAEARPEHLDAAITLIDYFQAHARRVLIHFGTEAPHVERGLAGRVALILRQSDGWIRTTELWDALGRNGTAADLHAALDALLAEGHIERRTEGTGAGRRTLWRWVEPVNRDSFSVDDLDDAESFGSGHDTFIDSYESTNQVEAHDGIDSFDSYEQETSPAGARAPSRGMGREAGDAEMTPLLTLSGQRGKPDDHLGEAEPDTCCLCGAPLLPGQRYKCEACTAEGVLRNADLFGEEPAG